jgi:hypothetical protein
MADGKSAFARIPGDDTMARVVRAHQVPLQAELLRAGAQWEESLSVLQEMVNHRRPFPDAPAALAWYRSPYHPTL